MRRPFFGPDLSTPFSSPTRLALRQRMAALALLTGGVVGFGATALFPAAASAQTKPAPATGAERELGPGDLLRDFIHYTLIDLPTAANQWGQALLAKNLSPAEFAKLVDHRDGYARFSKAVIDGQKNATTAPIASQLLHLYEEGKRAVARDPAAIAANIADLKGTQRQRLFARERLASAGEYAMPQLFSALVQGNDPVLHAEVRQLMVDMGRQAVVPLCTALSEVEPARQQVVVGILGDIAYTTSVPYLYELRAATKSNEVRAACDESIRRIVSVVVEETPVSDRFFDVAEKYYAESPSLTSFDGEPNQLWWTYDPGIGLVFQAIATPVFHEAMAMRLSERALMHDANNARATSLWLAANFSRELDSPANYRNPAYGADRRDAMYYAVAASAAPNQRVLGRAIDTNDTPLARKAIEAIRQTAGGPGLWAGNERRSLLEALRYPSRRVQYESALAIGAAQPNASFDGSDRVVPILAGAIRDAGARFALVIARDAERQTELAGVFAKQGYTVLPPGRRLADVEQGIADAPGVDILVCDLPSASTAELIDDARSRAKLRATPILALVEAQGYIEQAPRFQRDVTVAIARAGISGTEIAAAAEQLLAVAAGGPVSPDEAMTYKQSSIAVLRDLAVSQNSVLKVDDAAGPMILALGDSHGALKLQIAEVLSHVNTKGAQASLMDAASAAAGAERISLLRATAESAKRFGNLLESRHVSAIMEMARGAPGEEATAAAALMGALNLPNADLVPLILGQMKKS